jgi:hypothetical protein
MRAVDVTRETPRHSAGNLDSNVDYVMVDGKPALPEVVAGPDRRRGLPSAGF